MKKNTEETIIIMELRELALLSLYMAGIGARCLLAIRKDTIEDLSKKEIE